MEVDYFMMYPYVTFNDDTEITHSEMLPDDRVKVYIETPDLKDGFHNATCFCQNIHGKISMDILTLRWIISKSLCAIMPI